MQDFEIVLELDSEEIEQVFGGDGGDESPDPGGFEGGGGASGKW